VADVANAESQQEWYRMSISFRLPTQFTLADVDLPEIEYEDDCVTIHGIVSPSGQCGFSKEHGQYDVHMFTIAAWRDAQGNLIERELLVLRPVASGHDWGRDYPAFSTHRISVVLTKDGTRAVFNEALPPSPSDRGFVSIIARLSSAFDSQSSFPLRDLANLSLIGGSAGSRAKRNGTERESK
jgi:hypothetical protein